MRVLVFISVCLALSACTAEQPARQADTVALGSSIISARQAGQLFAQTCINALPDFAGTSKALADAGFTGPSSLGTFFSPRYNLSFNANAERCSMIFGTDKPSGGIASDLAAGTLSVVPSADVPRNIDITSNPGPDGLRYFRMVLPGET